MTQRNVKVLEHLLNELVSEEMMGVENRDKLAKALKKLSHAISTRNMKGVEKAVGEISKTLLIIKSSQP